MYRRYGQDDKQKVDKQGPISWRLDKHFLYKM